jgi:hypothetical protein
MPKHLPVIQDYSFMCQACISWYQERIKSLPCPQKPATCTVLSQTSPVHAIISYVQLIHLLLYSHLHLGLPSSPVPSGFRSKTHK